MRVLFIGLGSIGCRHARILAERPEPIEFIAYRSGNPRTDDIPVSVESYTDLYASLERGPDIAFVTNPTDLHVETALKCAEAGCDLFVEKPLSHSLAGVDRLVELSRERDLVTMVSCPLRFDPVLRRVRELVDAERFGRVNSFRAYSGSYLPDWRPDQDHRTSYSADPDRGGGVVLDLIHELDYLYWLFGEPTHLSADVATIDHLNIDSEAVAEILLRTEGGQIGNVHLDYCRRRPRRTFEVSCRDAVLVADLLESELTIERPTTTKTETYEASGDDRFRTQLSYFLDHVESRDSCENDFCEAKEVLHLALAAKENQLNE